MVGTLLDKPQFDGPGRQRLIELILPDTTGPEPETTRRRHGRAETPGVDMCHPNPGRLRRPRPRRRLLGPYEVS